MRGSPSVHANRFERFMMGHPAGSPLLGKPGSIMFTRCSDLHVKRVPLLAALSGAVVCLRSDRCDREARMGSAHLSVRRSRTHMRFGDSCIVTHFQAGFFESTTVSFERVHTFLNYMYEYV
jgi:hypothetical protein